MKTTKAKRPRRVQPHLPLGRTSGRPPAGICPVCDKADCELYGRLQHLRFAGGWEELLRVLETNHV